MIRRRATAGLMLTEVLVALAIFTVGMLGIIALFGAGTRRGQQSIDVTETALFIDSVFADLDTNYARRYRLKRGDSRGYPASLLSANGGQIPSNPLQLRCPDDWLQHPRYRYTISYEPLPNAPGGLLATVTLYWARRSSIHTQSAQRVLVVR